MFGHVLFVRVTIHQLSFHSGLILIAGEIQWLGDTRGIRLRRQGSKQSKGRELALEQVLSPRAQQSPLFLRQTFGQDSPKPVSRHTFGQDILKSEPAAGGCGQATPCA